MKLCSKIIWLIAIAHSVSPVYTFGRNSEPQTMDEQPVLRLEQDWLKALTERDRVSLNCILADEFVDCSWHGELRTKQQILAALGERAAYPQRLDDLKVSRYQQTAIVRGINIVTDQTGRGPDVNSLH
jgi:hypothetical protein